MRITQYTVLLLILALHHSHGEYTCDTGWKLLGDTCVYIAKERKDQVSWHMARDKCHHLNATLLTIRTQDKRDLIAQCMSGLEVWIDLFRDSSSDEFLWGNGPPQLNYTNWETGQPNNGGEGCAVMLTRYYKGQWNDSPCFEKYNYACETSGSRGCPDGMEVLAGRCYNFSSDVANWFEAREICQNNKADLVVLESEQRNELFIELLTNDHLRNAKTYWIGASDFREEGKWKWLDQNKEMEYQKWVEGAPNNGDSGIRACVLMDKYHSSVKMNGAWLTRPCNAHYHSVCEEPPTYSDGRANCPNDSRLYGNETCIRVLTDHYATWAGSRDKCKKLGGDLVVIKDEKKSKFVRGVAQTRSVWVGLHYLENDGYWRWLDLEEEVTYFDWHPSHSNPLRGRHCVFMRGTSTSKGTWANTVCSRDYGYICEVEVIGGCNDGWKRFGGRCYKFNYDITGWQDARDRCKLQHQKSDLAVVDKHTEQRWLQEQLDTSSDVSGFWIGLNSFSRKNFFVWLNASSQTQYQNWDARMPSYTNDEACVSAGGLRVNSTWKDDLCDLARNYICEKPAGGDPSYYDFRYNHSVYKILTTKLVHEHGDEVCQKVLGVNATLVIIDGDDEIEMLQREIEIRGFSQSNKYWTRGNNSVTSKSTVTSAPKADFGSEQCMELWFEEYDWRLKLIRPKLQMTPCCNENNILCEKHIDQKLINKYDFALDSSIYRLVDDELLEHDAAKSRCSTLLDNSGSLAKFETWQELEAVSREVLARHSGEHFVYWVSGDPINKNSTDIAHNITGGKDSHCLTLDYDPDKSKKMFNAKMSLKAIPCTGKKRFLCEQKGIQMRVLTVAKKLFTHWNTYKTDQISNNQEKSSVNYGCTGPCIGLAVALPFVAMGSVLLTVAYFWFIQRRSPAPVRFGRLEEEVNLTI